MKDVIADLFVSTHGKNRFAGGLNDGHDESRCERNALHRQCQHSGRQTSREIAPDKLRDWRSLRGEALTRGCEFTAHRIIIMQIERPQERLECESLDHKRSQDYRERCQ
jgi:hypothetical protein